MHESMVLSFANLATKQVMWGAFANMVNELLRVNYDRRGRLPYMRVAAHMIDGIGGENMEPQPFSSYGDANGYAFFPLSLGSSRALCMPSSPAWSP